MLSKMDDSIGIVVDALRQKKMLENSIIIFSTDNGGPAEGFNLNAASNWPLRGVKVRSRNKSKARKRYHVKGTKR